MKEGNTVRFFKENSYYIHRLIITHIGMSVFGLVLLLATNQISSVLMLLASLFSTLFFGTLVYATLWDKGAKDKAALDAGRIHHGFGHGFFIAFLGEAISMLLCVLYFICALCVNIHALFGKIGAVLYTVLMLSDGCFIGTMFYLNPRADNTALVAPILIAGSLIVSLFGGAGYVLGVREIQLLPRVSHKK